MTLEEQYKTELWRISFRLAIRQRNTREWARGGEYKAQKPPAYKKKRSCVT
jgi:hypothetical protein